MKKLSPFHKAQLGGINFTQEKNNRPQTLFFIFIIGIFIALIILILRLFQLTIVKGSYYRRLSEQNRIRELIIEPKRGKIIDRKGFVLAENTQANINVFDERIISKRIYSSPEVTSHIVGFRQSADTNDLKNDVCLNKLIPGDKTGKKGIEKLFDCQLRGTLGKKLVEIDARGKFLNTISVLPPVDGNTIQLALDLQLQQVAYNIIQNKKAAIIGQKPKTGEIILLVSTPSFNSQAFEDGNNELVNNYLINEDKPLFNRALVGTYPPGSTFKIPIATGALEENKITQNTIVEDTGQIKAGAATFGNWYFIQYGKTEGPVNVIKAIQRSNDIYFYKIGEKLGVGQIARWAGIFGYGKITGIGFEEADGLIPSSFWKEENLHDQWYLGDTYNLSIGQGYVLATPIQVNQATSVIANDGYLCKPQLIKNAPPQCTKLPISEKNLALIKQGMTEACVTGGTGWPLFNFKTSSTSAEIKTACKTGTSESQTKTSEPHAWFTVFAPAVNPEIILTVLVEEGGQGSDVGGPIARDILKAYFERKE